MKRCPRCNQVYADDSLNFCLADGAPLSPVGAPEVTVSIQPQLDTSSTISSSHRTRASRRGVSPIFAYAGAGLLILLIGGGIVMWFRSGAMPSPGGSPDPTPSGTVSPTPPTPNKAPVPKLYRVVGVAEDDVLYIRSKPGRKNIHVGKIPANGVDIQILEGTERVGQSTWVRVNYEGITGWVNSRFLTEQ